VWIKPIVETLENEKRVLFAYLYGSVAAGEKGNDIDIAIYSTIMTSRPSPIHS